MEAVNARIKANGRREITGDILNDVLRAMVVELGAGYQLGGTIRPGDKPKVEDLRVAYLTVEPGMYLYAGGFEVTELSLITYGAEWYMYPLGVPFGSQIAEDIAAAVDAEKMRAMAAEKTLSDAIATEEREREAADSSLDSAIKAEAKRASDAEGVLTKAVEDEKARAMAAEGANASAITAEADARAKADTTLQGNINTEESERKAADQTLQDNINAEKTRATTAEATLTKNINTESVERKAADTALGTRVASIEAKIPAQATAENKLADKDFVNSSIATATATFRGTFDTLEALKAAQADKNDYAFWVHKDEVGNTCYDKYTYTGTEWLFEYRLNNSSFTAAQWAALNSGVTADVIKALQDADKANAKAIADEKVAREQADTTLQGNIDKKQDIIVDLSTIREESANGQTAFSWGDHAEAGYVKPFVITIMGDGTAENPYRVVGDIDVNEVQNALNAHNLILLNIDDTILPLTEAFRRAENVRGITLQFVTMYGDGYEREEYIINIAWDGVTIDYYDYMYVTYDQIQSEETERKAADQTLQANIDEKVDKSDGLWLENFMPRIQLDGDGTTSAPTVGDNRVADYQHTSYYLGKYGGVVTPFDDENVYGRVVQVNELDDNKLYVTAIFNNGVDFSDNFANSLYEIVLNFAADGSFESGTYTVKPLGGGGLSTIQAGRVPNSVYLEYEGLGGNNEPIFIDNYGTALTREQICRLLADKSANQVVLINTAASDEVPREQTSTAKFLQVEEDAFIIGFVGANADGQIFDILYKWDATEAKVLRAELLYNPTA